MGHRFHTRERFRCSLNLFSNDMKTSTQGGFSSGILDPVSSVHDGFNNMDLPSTSVVRPSTISNGRSLMDNPEDQFKIGLFMPALCWGVLLGLNIFSELFGRKLIVQFL